MFTTVEIASILLSVTMAIAAGLVGCFAVMRRMTLAADSISHVALPGIGIALALRIHPLAGAVAALFFGGLLIWALEQRTRIATETVIGVVFSTALAVGSLMSSGENLIDALFGGSGAPAIGEIVFGLLAASVIVFFILRYKSRLVLSLISPDLAHTAGVNVARLDLLFLLLFSLTVALGLRYLGVLLMGSLIIIPAATARRLAANLKGMLFWATTTAVIATLLGTFFARLLDRPTGPVIICVAAFFFLLSLAKR